LRSQSGSEGKRLLASTDIQSRLALSHKEAGPWSKETIEGDYLFSGSVLV